MIKIQKLDMNDIIAICRIIGLEEINRFMKENHISSRMVTGKTMLGYSQKGAAPFPMAFAVMYDLSRNDKRVTMFILPRIAYFLKNNIGIPSVLTKIADDGKVENEEQARQQWNSILETICDGFHMYLEKSFSDFTDEKKELWNKAKKYLIDYFECLWY